MSVENQTVEATESAVKVENQKSVIMDEASLRSEATESSSKGEVTTTTEVEPESAQKSTGKISADRARDWFKKLDVEERVSALAFWDEPFLGALLRSSSWSPQPCLISGFSEGQFCRCCLRGFYVILLEAAIVLFFP